MMNTAGLHHDFMFSTKGKVSLISATLYKCQGSRWCVIQIDCDGSRFFGRQSKEQHAQSALLRSRPASYDVK